MERQAFQYVKSVLGLKNNTNSNKVRLTMARPKVEHMLWVLLRKNMKKYESHFGIRPSFYDIGDKLYTEWLRKGDNILFRADLYKMPDSVLRNIVEERRLSYMANLTNTKLGSNFRESVRKNWYNFPDGRDSLLIRFLTNVGFFNSRMLPERKRFGKPNNRRHAANDCYASMELRDKTLKEVREVTKYNTMICRD